MVVLGIFAALLVLAFPYGSMEGQEGWNLVANIPTINFKANWNLDFFDCSGPEMCFS